MTFLHKAPLSPETTDRGRHAALVTVAASVTLILGSALLSGCSMTNTSSAPSAQPFPNATSAPSSAGTSGLPDKNIEQWVMPLDQYSIGDSKTSDYAENLLVQPCMEKAGFTWNVPWRDVSGTDGPSWNAVHIRLTNLNLAKEWGYHLAPTNDTSLRAWIAFVQEKSNIGASEETAVTKCIFAARKTLPVLPGNAQLADGYALAAWEGAQKDSAVLATASKWHECMIPAGVSDLPDNPEDMPSLSVRQRFNIKLSVSPNPPVVSKPEKVMAAKDESCRLSSQYSKVFYDAEWDRQAKLVQKNADALQRVKAMLTANRAAVTEVISSHAPSH